MEMSIPYFLGALAKNLVDPIGWVVAFLAALFLRNTQQVIRVGMVLVLPAALTIALAVFALSPITIESIIAALAKSIVALLVVRPSKSEDEMNRSKSGEKKIRPEL